MAAVVIGIGNEWRGDDAVGREVVRSLRGTLGGSVRLTECNGMANEILDAWEGCDRAILVDAVRTGAAPGSLTRLDCSQTLPETGLPVSTHGFGVREAIELARNIGRLPETVIVYGVEASNFEMGAPLSAPVARAVATATRRVAAEVERPGQSSTPPPQ